MRMKLEVQNLGSLKYPYLNLYQTLIQKLKLSVKLDMHVQLFRLFADFVNFRRVVRVRLSIILIANKVTNTTGNENSGPFIQPLVWVQVGMYSWGCMFLQVQAGKYSCIFLQSGFQQIHGTGILTYRSLRSVRTQCYMHVNWGAIGNRWNLAKRPPNVVQNNGYRENDGYRVPAGYRVQHI